MATKFADGLAGADIASNSVDKLHSLGTYRETADGRGFRYAKVGATATVAGKVYQSPAEDTTNGTLSGGFATAAAAIGATEVVTTTTGTIGADDFADGYMSVVVTPGQGYTYAIKSNAAATAAAYSVTLKDPLVVALTTSSNVIFVKHPYKGIIVEPGTPTGVIVGVAPFIVTAAYYGWVQTFGPCAVLFTGTGAAGKVVGSLTGGTAGSSAPAIAATNILGEHMGTGITGEYSMIFLRIH